MNPLADFVDVIREKWWQGDEPPVAGHTIANDLSIVVQLIKDPEQGGSGWDREELLGALSMYDGSPATLRLTYARGQRHLLERLRAKWLDRQELNKTAIRAILKEMAA